MNKEEILEEQIKALEKLMQLKNEIIQELETKLKNKSTFTLPNITSVPSFQPYNPFGTTSGTIVITNCKHDYSSSNIWPRRCSKCNQVETNITYTNA